MKLRNKKTREIADLNHRGLLKSDNNNHIIVYPEGTLKCYAYNSLAELNEDWEDVPEEFWSINGDATIEHFDRLNENDLCKQIGNYFETEEEAEKAIEKLKAIQRLKNYYLKFKLDFVKNKIDFTYRLDDTLHSSVDEERIIFEDMNLLFGGEE
jgi:hypothetical protein